MTTREIDVDKAVEIARRYARENEWCDVVEEALREMGLVKGTPVLTITIPLEDYLGTESDFFNLYDVALSVEAKNWDAVHRDRNILYDSFVTDKEAVLTISEDANKVKNTIVRGDWFYTSNDSRVLHWMKPTVNEGWYGDSYRWTLCGREGITSRITKNSPLGTGKRCEVCDTRYNKGDR